MDFIGSPTGLQAIGLQVDLQEEDEGRWIN